MGRVVRNVSADDVKQLGQGSPDGAGSDWSDGSDGSSSMPGFDLDSAAAVEGASQPGHFYGGAA